MGEKEIMKYQEFGVAGTINVTESDGGLISPVDKPVHLRGILINSDATEGNHIEGWIGTDRIMSIPDYCCDTQEEAAAQHALSSTKLNRIPIEEDIPPGKIFKIAIRCGAVANDIFGAYEYDEKVG